MEFKIRNQFLILLLVWAGAVVPAHSQTQNNTSEIAGKSCANSFTLLEQSLLSRSQNRVALLKVFYPTRDAHPIFVTVNYIYNSSTVPSEVWYWSESEFYLVQPLEVFQFTSLFFANSPQRHREVTLQLDEECAGVDTLFMELLTQRLKLYAQSATTSPDADTTKISDLYIAVAASQKEVEADSFQSDFIKAWLHIFLILFPISTAILLYLCDPVQLLLGAKTWQKLEDEHNHPTVAALIQISVLFTIFVFMVDWLGFAATINSDYLSYDKHAAFYLSVITGLVVDFVAFGWVMFVLITSCHWDCKNLWHKWMKHACKASESETIKKLMSTVMFAPILCISNHLHYIILATISDPFHAGSIGIVYFLSFLLSFFVFKQFYARRVLHVEQPPKATPTYTRNPRELKARSIARMSTTNLEVKRVAQHVPFNTQVVVFGLMLIGPLLILYQALIIIVFFALPITKTLEDSPSSISTIYQGTGVLIVALLTYSIILRPSPFALGRAISLLGKELHLPKRVKGWNRLADEEKFAFVLKTLLHHEGDPEVLDEVPDVVVRETAI